MSLAPEGARWLLLSCCIGVGISYSGWRLKDLVTATTFTLVGVLNKMATIALSALAFPGATSARGCVALLACLLFGVAYQDAPLRPQAVPRGSGTSKARDSDYSPPGDGLPSPGTQEREYGITVASEFEFGSDGGAGGAAERQAGGRLGGGGFGSGGRG